MEVAKRGRLRFLSHLDLVRLLDRAVRRARIPVAYTEGFHPHARLTLGPPLPVGMEGLREPVCVDLERPAPAGELAVALSREFPAGLELVALETAWRGRRSPLGVERAEYSAELGEAAQTESVQEAVQKLLAAPQWRVERASKRKVAVVDIRPGLLHLECLPEPRPRLVMEVSLEPERLVKPDEVVQALAQEADLPEVPTCNWVRHWVRQAPGAPGTARAGGDSGPRGGKEPHARP